MSSAATRGATPADRPRTARAPSRRSIRHWIPPQHGVWAILLLPYLAGLQFGLDWWQIPLLIGWLTGWLFSHHVLLAVKTRRLARVRRQIAVYGTICAAMLLPVVAVRPGLLWFAPIFLALLAVNVFMVRGGQERATVNGIVSVTMASLMSLIAPATAQIDWTVGIPVATVAWVYLAGSVFYIKSMIREHGSRQHWIASGVYHAVALVIAVFVWPWLAVPFGLTLARAVVLPGRPRMRVPIVGAAEIGISLVVLGFLLVMPR